MSTEPDLRPAYTALAASYEANRDQFRMDEVLDDIFARLPQTGHLLDLGCGAGEPVARTFLQRGWRVTGVDFCPAMLDLAGLWVPAMTRIRADMRELSLPGGQFDAVTAVYSLFHIPWTQHPALFARIRDWLKPGGTLLFTYATRDYTGAERFDGLKTFMGQSLYYSHTTPEELCDQLAGAGLPVVQALERTIGGETFLWVTAQCPQASGAPDLPEPGPSDLPPAH
jgi:cyclopropane fatty-acyl-phospholipid synthase-like methyltransferase